MADLTLTADAQELVLTIGAESHRLPLADVGHLHRRIDMAVAEARSRYAAKMQAEKHAAVIAAAKELHPDGWALPDGRWGFVNEAGQPRVSPEVGQMRFENDYRAIAAAPAETRWRNHNGRLLHIGGGTGYRCGELPWRPTLELAGSSRRVCPRCAVGVTP